MSFIINPGAGLVKGACLKQAWKNMRKLRRECCPGASIVRLESSGDYGGRYGFRLGFRKPHGKTRFVVVDMPGVAAVASADLSQACRLYVNGSSWWWRFAKSVIREEFGLESVP